MVVVLVVVVVVAVVFAVLVAAPRQSWCSLNIQYDESDFHSKRRASPAETQHPARLDPRRLQPSHRRNKNSYTTRNQPNATRLPDLVAELPLGLHDADVQVHVLAHAVRLQQTCRHITATTATNNRSSNSNSNSKATTATATATTATATTTTTATATRTHWHQYY